MNTIKLNIEWIKELFTAHYDPELDKIQGCREFSMAWFHEHRHREQVRIKPIRWIMNKLHILFYCLGIFFLLFGVTANIFKPAVYVTGIFAIPYLSALLLLEIDAIVVGLYRFLHYESMNVLYTI